jgi:hypothetical protein
MMRITNPKIVPKGNFTDRGRGQELVLSASTSPGEVAEQVETHGIDPCGKPGVKDEMLVLCVRVHVTAANV